LSSVRDKKILCGYHNLQHRFHTIAKFEVTGRLFTARYFNILENMQLRSLQLHETAKRLAVDLNVEISVMGLL